MVISMEMLRVLFDFIEGANNFGFVCLYLVPSVVCIAAYPLCAVCLVVQGFTLGSCLRRSMVRVGTQATPACTKSWSHFYCAESRRT